MQVLFLHQNFPGQFPHLAARLARLGHEVHAVGVSARDVPGVRLHRYTPVPPPAGHRPYPASLAEFSTKLIRAQACAELLDRLRREAGLAPDVVVTHPGWGEALFARDVFPRAAHLHFLEFFYRAQGQDVGFDPEFSVEPRGDAALAAAVRLRMKNYNGLLSLDVMDRGLSPTRWQASTYPARDQSRIEVIFDGVDSAAIAPDASARLRLPDGRELGPDDEVVSFINRNLEPYRGYHVFMRALPELMRLRPRAQFVLVGADGVSYGAPPPRGRTWKEVFLDEVRDRVDVSRLHFTGLLPRADLTRLLQVSRCHVYLTYPFVMSWSAVEAMSAACPLVASDTAPVREFVSDGEHGRLFGFFDREALVEAVVRTLEDRPRAHEMAMAARQRVLAQFDLETVCLPRQVSLVEELARGNA